jgi:hypothetical protein
VLSPDILLAFRPRFLQRLDKCGRVGVKYMITGAVLLAAVTVDALARRERERVQVT